MLYACYALAEKEKGYAAELAAIRARYQEIIDGLGLKVDLTEEFKKLDSNFKQKIGTDYAASRGEYLNGILMADYLGYTFIDAADVIFFTENGDFDAEKTNDVLGEKLESTEKAVIPGFYGSMPDGSINRMLAGFSKQA